MRIGKLAAGVLLALACSSVGTAWLLSLCLPLLPHGLLATTIFIAAVALVFTGVATVERRLLWQRWLEPRAVTDLTRRPRSSLLQGFAPLPISLGVVVGALLALKLL